ADGYHQLSTTHGRPDDPAEQRADRQSGVSGQPKTDRYGDPLPASAIARLGTTRFRHGDYVASIVFSPDSKRILSISCGGIVLWDPATGRELQRIRAESGNYFDHAQFTADGKSIVILEHSGTGHVIRIRDGADLSVSRELTVNQVIEPCFSRDGKL